MPAQSREPIAYEFGEFTLDVRKCELSDENGKILQLANNPYNLLIFLIKNRQRVVTNDEIYAEIWKDDLRGGGNLEDLVSSLRKALESEKKAILTIPKRGKRFGLEVKEIFEVPPPKPPDPSGSKKTAADPPTFEDWLKNSKLKWWFRATVALTIVFSITVFSISFLTINQRIEFAISAGSISNVLLVIISLVYYWKYSSRRLKNFRPFSEDTTSDLLKDEVKEATKCKDKLDWETTRDNARDGSGIFRFCWQALLLVWIFLYILLAFKTKDNYILGALMTDTNNLNTLLLAICFYTFSKLEKGLEEFKQNSFWLFALLFIVVLGLVEVGLLQHSDLLSEIIKPPLGTDMKYEISWGFRVISGIGGAIALALFVGRLQSKFFNAATKFVVIFFSYIAIQPLFVFFEDNSLKMQFVTAIVVHIAVALKYFLFLYLFWAFESGRLLFYLVRVRQANKEVEDEWQKFQIVFEKNSSSKSLSQ